ncbi:MAG: CapA family protein [Lachnospiraceae bacterium]
MIKRTHFYFYKQNIGLLAAAFLLALPLTGCSAAKIVDQAGELLGVSSPAVDEKEVPVQEKSEEDLPVIVFETGEPEKTEEPEAEFVYDDVNKIYSMETASEDELTLAFAGDICFYDEYANMTTLRAQSNGIYDCILPQVMEEMKSSDIFMVNNEFAYSDRGTPTAGKKYTFRAKPQNVGLLSDMGVDIVSLANNHSYDYGPEALYDTIDILNEAKVPFVGAGKTIEEAKKPVYFKANGQTIAYVSATQIERTENPDTKEATETSPGVLRTLYPEAFLEVIENARENSDFVVVFVHWGSENTDLVEESQRDLAQKYAEAGADLIIGAHSHCLQGVDYIGEVPVFYSMGNFWFNSKTVDTGLVKVTLNKESEIQNIRFVPCIQQSCKTRIADSTEKQRILTYLQGISNYAVIDSEGNVTKSDTDHNIQNGQNTSPSKKMPVPESDTLLPLLPDMDTGTEAAENTY